MHSAEFDDFGPGILNLLRLEVTTNATEQAKMHPLCARFFLRHHIAWPNQWQFSRENQYSMAVYPNGIQWRWWPFYIILPSKTSRFGQAKGELKSAKDQLQSLNAKVMWQHLDGPGWWPGIPIDSFNSQKIYVIHKYWMNFNDIHRYHFPISLQDICTKIFGMILNDHHWELTQPCRGQQPGGAAGSGSARSTRQGSAAHPGDAGAKSEIPSRFFNHVQSVSIIFNVDWVLIQYLSSVLVQCCLSTSSLLEGFESLESMDFALSWYGRQLRWKSNVCRANRRSWRLELRVLALIFPSTKTPK